MTRRRDRTLNTDIPICWYLNFFLPNINITLSPPKIGQASSQIEITTTSLTHSDTSADAQSRGACAMNVV